jgi:exosortase
MTLQELSPAGERWPAGLQAPGAPRAERRGPSTVTLCALFLLPLALGYATTCEWVVDRWLEPESYFSHGPLVPVVALAVLWLRRREWQAVPAQQDPRGWLVLGPGLLLHLCGAALMIDSLSAASLPVSLVGVAWLMVGRARLAVIWPVLALVLFTIPLPIFMTGRIAFELKEIAIDASVAVGTALGLAVERRAADLYVEPHSAPLKVADACSGLRSMMALTTLGYCVAFFMGPQHGPRRWILLASAVPIAVLTNILRITGICFVARSAGVPYASTTGHELLRWAAWLAALGMLIALDRVLCRLQRPR